jgi:cysteine desulfurase / selenocysteine lyase
MIYCDNAATSFPKPPEVLEAVNAFMRDVGSSAGRGAHAGALAASRTVFDTRESLATLFKVGDAGRIIFTLNATEALNQALFGTLRRGNRVALSSMEHNAVMRPLRYLQTERGVVLETVPNAADGAFDLRAWEAALKRRPAMAIVNHGSNIIGSIAPIEEIGALCAKYDVRFLVDAAQTAGIVPIDVTQMNIDLLAFSGHKGLLGPQGTGGLYIKETLDLAPLKFGGTGSDSERDEQPHFLPDRFESGTLNGPGLAGLGAGVAYVNNREPRAIFAHGSLLSARLLDGLRALPRARLFGPQTPHNMLPTLSFTIDGMDNADVARRLDDDFRIAVRVGLHCAPQAHKTVGTFPKGTVRISLGYFNTEEEVEEVVSAVGEICRGE